MSRKYFGTDGVRGRVGEFPITPDFAMRLGYAAGKVLVARTGSEHPAVLIGKDTRVSGYMLEAALEAGFAAAGVDVMLAGPMPTPAVAYLTRALRLAAGVVISASHNPFEDNGIKFFSATGFKLPDEIELQIEAQLEAPMGCEPSERLGKARRIDDAAGRYIEFCKSTFPGDLDLRGLKIVVDSAHGAAYHIAGHVFHELGADVINIGNRPNGFNINEQCGATHPSTLEQAVLEHGADLGVALDGDADRLLMVGANGVCYNGDQLLYVMACERMLRNHLAGVAGTLMTNLALENFLKANGVGFARAKVGDRYVMELLQEKGWVLGGEGSGHIICLDRHTTGDGLVSALQILIAMRRTGKSLAELTAGLTLYPQKLINVRMTNGFDWKNHTPLQQAQNDAQAQLGQRGRILIRASGTEPLLRVMVEAEDGAQAETLAQQIASTIA